MELGAADVRSLRRSIRDLVALTTLPAIWAGSQPHEIAKSLADVLLTLVHLDVVYVYLKRFPEDQTFELVRMTDQLILGDQAHEIGKTFTPWLKVNPSDPVHEVIDPVTGNALNITVIAIGYHAIDGFVVAGAYAPDALTELDRLLLGVATNQAVTALQQAKLLADLRAANQLKDSSLLQEQAALAEAQHTAQNIFLLQELTSKLSQSLTIEEIAQVTLQTVTKLFASDGGAIYTVSSDGEFVQLLVSIKSPHRDALGPIPLTTSTPITEAIQTRTVVFVESLVEYMKRYPHLEQTARDANIQSLAVAPFLIKDQVWGCFELSFALSRTFSHDEVNLLLAVAQQCALALERARLNEQAQITAAAEERHRLARDLHDAVSQVLFAATVIAESLPGTWGRSPERALDQLQQVVVYNHAAMAEMRKLLLELRPEVIVKSRLDQLLMHLVEAAKGRRTIDAHLTIEGEEEPFPPDVIVALYRIAQEGINNMLKHSEATEFWVYLQHQSDQAILQIHDNGRGFNQQNLSSGIGLQSMRERAEAIHADFKITSTIGEGTKVRIAWQRTQPAATSANRLA
jgi:signal transduction histidine kinase